MLALLALFGLLSSAHGFNVRSARPSGSLQSYRTGAPRLAVDEARLKLIKGGLPQKFAERVSFQSSGQRQAGQEEEILILWREFKKCYPSEKVALQMLSKNTAVILPQLNSPRKIKGTYALLQKRLGKAATSELLLKNPGVLVCSPEGLAKLSDKVGGKARTRMMHVARVLKPLRSGHELQGPRPERVGSLTRRYPAICHRLSPPQEILDAAELVASLEANKPLIGALSGLVGVLIIGAIAARIGTVNGADMSPGGLVDSMVTNNPYFR